MRLLTLIPHAFLLLPFAMFPAMPASGQTVPFFYRTDYAVNYAQLGEMGSVVVADLNNDGKPDFAIGAGFGIAVALGNGDGTFQPIAIVVPTGAGINGGWTLSAVAADFDGDGNIDLVLVPEGGQAAAIAILPGNGDGTFGPGYVLQAQGFLAPVTSTQMVEAADLNHDGHPDLLLLTENNSFPPTASAFLFLNNGNGTFTSHSAFNLPSNQYAVGLAIADFNGDGNPDLAVLGQVLSGFAPLPSVLGHVYIALGNGSGSFSLSTTVISLSTPPSFIVAADFNRDGFPDLAVQIGETTILLNQGNGTFLAGTTINLCCSNPGTIVAADWTGSGSPGVGIFTGVTPNGIGIMVSNGNGAFYSGGTALLDEHAGTVYSFASADFNGDGRADLIVPSGGHTVSVLLNAGNGPPLSFVPSSAATDIMSVTPASIATIYGQIPTTSTQSNAVSPPPLQLAGVTVTIQDSTGASLPAPLFYVSPTQINLEIPPGTALGAASIVVAGNGSTLMGSALIRNVVPEIFTEQGVTFQGSLYPAAYAITYGPDGQAGAPVLVAACQSAAGRGQRIHPNGIRAYPECGARNLHRAGCDVPG